MSGLGESDGLISGREPQQRGSWFSLSGTRGDSSSFPNGSALSESRHRWGWQWDVPPRLALVVVGLVLVAAALLSVGPSDGSARGIVDDGSAEHGVGKKMDYSGHAFGGKSTLDEASDAWKSRERARASASGEAVPSPNVIFVLVDDVGMNDMGPSSTDLSGLTPFIDSLAADGIRISKYYTNEICTPARASLMTGRDTFRTGMQYEETQSYQPWGLPLNEATLAQRFKAAGYSTHMAGKWNLGNFAEQYYPFNRGFDTFLGYMGAQETYYGHAWGGYKDFGYGDEDGYLDTSANTTRWGPELEGYYSTSVTGDRAIQVAQAHKEASADGSHLPLFMYLAFQAIHYPLDTPQESLFSDEQLKTLSMIKTESPVRMEFAKMLYFLDITLERVVGELDSLGLMDNTLLVLASDNGGCPIYGGSNYPYRGVKHTLFEGGVRTPAFVYSKSEDIIPLKARGSEYSDMMHVTDWTPTLASVTGIPTDTMGLTLSGLDHWSAIIGSRPAGSPAIRNELVLNRNSYVYDELSSSMVLGSTPSGAYIYDGWKINIGDKCTDWFSFNPDDNVHTEECNTGECATCTGACDADTSQSNDYLFHLETDPYETVNLANAMPEKFQEMRERWDLACVDEVPSGYKFTDLRAFKKWGRYNDWVVAWLADEPVV